MRVREIQKSDLSSIHRLGAMEFKDYSEAGFERMAGDELYKFWVAEVDDNFAGFLVVLTVDEKLEIIDIATEPKFRRMGVAKSLLGTAIQFAQECGKVGLILEVNEHNLPARGLYESLGFKEIYVRKKYYECKDDAIIMERMI